MKSIVSVNLLDVHLVAAKIANLLSVLSPVTTIILVIIVGAYVTYRKRQSKLEYHINKLPGPYSLPLIGNGLQVSLGSKDDFLDRVVSAQKMYGRRIGLSRAWNGPFPYVLISKASAAE
ncbi:hypothetical protein pipiens_016923, partial [Culex pipiens pipiens]